jgi:peptidoglycan hydrolase CwlO-like protein
MTASQNAKPPIPKEVIELAKEAEAAKKSFKKKEPSNDELRAQIGRYKSLIEALSNL